MTGAEVEDDDEPRTLIWVAAYFVRRKLGGPEEGGWYFDERTLVTDPALYARLEGAPAAFLTEAGARVWEERLRDRLPLLNEGRRPLDSVLSDGRYTIMIMHAPTLPLIWPEQPPHYA